MWKLFKDKNGGDVYLSIRKFTPELWGILTLLLILTEIFPSYQASWLVKGFLIMFACVSLFQLRRWKVVPPPQGDKG